MKIELPKLPKRLRPYKFLVLLVPLFMILNYRGDGKFVADRRILGHWEGSGRVIKSGIHEQLGYIDIDLTIHEDMSAEGTIGDAVITGSRLVRHFRVFEKDGNTLHCELEGEVKEGSGIERDRFSLRLYLTSPNKIGFTSFRYGSIDGMATLKRVAE